MREFKIPKPGTLLRVENQALRTDKVKKVIALGIKLHYEIPKNSYIMFLSFKEEEGPDYRYTFIWGDKIWTTTWLIAHPRRFFTEFVTICNQENT